MRLHVMRDITMPQTVWLVSCVQTFFLELIVFAPFDIQEKQNLISVLVLIGKMNYHHSLKQLQKQLG